MKKSHASVQLTKAEEQIMQALWNLKQATVQDILEVLEVPKPARTTVSTVLSILENKGFVSHTTAGRVNTYLPLIKKEQYSRSMLSGLLHNYFNGSFATMASFFAKDNNYTVEELDQMIEQTRKELTEEHKK